MEEKIHKRKHLTSFQTIIVGFMGGRLALQQEV